MSEAFKVEKKVQNGVEFMHVSGMITEDSQLDSLTSSECKIVVVDLEKVERINSYGIRQWINTLKELQAHIEQLVFIKCPPIIVEQFNMISNFGAGGMVFSFYLPFYSEELDENELVLCSTQDIGDIEDPEEIVEKLAQKIEKSDLYEFNDLEDEYFSFLQYQKDKSISEELIGMIA